MRGFFCTAALLALTSGALAAQEMQDRIDSVVFECWAPPQAPVTQTTVGRQELQAANPTFSLPMALQLQPSVVTWNEGGTGLGNSSMTIRGVKGSQINVTLNGITLNDAESQEVFWVNIPSLPSLLSTVQVQRGLGTSTHGAGDFGAAVNMDTGGMRDNPFGAVSLSFGSYATGTASVSAGTGLTRHGFYASFAWSGDQTDGYIRNAFVRSQSAFALLGWRGRKDEVRLTYLMGRQRSGITWDGIDLEQYAADRRYNGAGEYTDDEGNVCYYDNQTDNYFQHHAQLTWDHRFTRSLRWANTLNYTRGDGYDEYYKTGRSLALYGFPADPATGTAGKSDVIYRKKMGNDHWVANSSVFWTRPRFDLTAGANAGFYGGDHFGELLWVRTLGRDWDYAAMNAADSWYRSRSRKGDVSAFARGVWTPLRTQDLKLYAHLQYRRVDYRMAGTDDDRLPLDYARTWNFFNPRAGASWLHGPHKVYASVALGHREPGRSDIKDNLKGGETPIRPERMTDFELGYQFTGDRFKGSANLYCMEYRDMLLETGRLNDSGYAVKENVPRAWRRGIELAAIWQPVRPLVLEGNATLSRNRIADYVSYVSVYGSSPAATVAVPYGETDMLMSPSLIGMARASWLPWKNGRLSLDAKYVGKQFLDNTMREELAVPAYWVADLEISQSVPFFGGSLEIAAFVNNLFNRLYYASGWRWESWYEGAITTGVGVYPQAPTNATLRLSYRF